MLKIRINRGGIPLKGKIPISGAKNASLPIMVSSLLTEDPLVLDNVPNLMDVRTLSSLLNIMGTEIENRTNNSITLTTKDIKSISAPYDLVKQMRATILVLGPTLARCGQAKVSMPGGCAIGVRPVDLHIKGMEALGANVKLENGYIVAKAPTGGLAGASISLPMPTVTGTENILMAAVLAKGKTIINNAAREPEISDLANCLNKMGAEISGHGTSTIVVNGVKRLYGTTHTIISDRIEAGTYAIAAAITGGSLDLIGKNLSSSMPDSLNALRSIGLDIRETQNGISINSVDKNRLSSIRVMTEPFPGFSTDLQAQFMALLSTIKGTSYITENIWENRFMHVPELCRMGANISVNGFQATIHGVNKLNGASVMATDLRASFSLVLAGLAANGSTIIDRTYHLSRGYECAVEKLRACGADIEEVNS